MSKLFAVECSNSSSAVTRVLFIATLTICFVYSEFADCQYLYFEFASEDGHLVFETNTEILIQNLVCWNETFDTHKHTIDHLPQTYTFILNTHI